MWRCAALTWMGRAAEPHLHHDASLPNLDQAYRGLVRRKYRRAQGNSRRSGASRTLLLQYRVQTMRLALLRSLLCSGAHNECKQRETVQPVLQSLGLSSSVSSIHFLLCPRNAGLTADMVATVSRSWVYAVWAKSLHLQPVFRSNGPIQPLPGDLRSVA